MDEVSDVITLQTSYASFLCRFRTSEISIKIADAEGEADSNGIPASPLIAVRVGDNLLVFV